MPPKPTPDRKSGAWSPEERERLRMIVKTKWLNRPDIIMQAQREGVNVNAAVGVQWSQVAAEHGTRNSKQCRERWDNHERDDLKRDPIKRGTEIGNWIENYMRERGNKWAEIGRMVNRPENQVKNFGFQVLKAQMKEKTAKDNEMAEAAHREAAQHSRNPSVSSMPSLASDHGSPLDPKSPYVAAPVYMSPHHRASSPRAYPYMPYESKRHSVELPPLLPSARPVSSNSRLTISALTTPVLDQSQPYSNTASPASLLTPGASPSQGFLGTPVCSPTRLFSQVDSHDDEEHDTLWNEMEKVIGRTSEQRRALKLSRRANHRRDFEPKIRSAVGHNESVAAQVKWVLDKREAIPNYFETVSHS